MAERMGSRADRPSLILAPIPFGENTALLPPSLSPLWLSQAVKGNNEIQPVGPGARSGALACVEAVCAGTSAAWQRPEHTPLSPRPGTGPDDTWPQNDDRKRQRTMARGGGEGREAGGGTRAAMQFIEGEKQCSSLGFFFFPFPFSFLFFWLIFVRSSSMKAESYEVLSRLS